MSEAGNIIAGLTEDMAPNQLLTQLIYAVRALHAEKGSSYALTTGDYLQPIVGGTCVIPVVSNAFAVGSGILVSRRAASGAIGGTYVVEGIVDNLNIIARRLPDTVATVVAGGSVPSGSSVTVGVANPVNVLPRNAVWAEAGTYMSGEFTVYWEQDDSDWTLVSITPTSAAGKKKQLWIPPGENTAVFTGLSGGTYTVSVWAVSDGRFSPEVFLNNSGLGYVVT